MDIVEEVETPLLDSVWDSRVLKWAKVMLGRLLCGYGPNNDHWDLGLVVAGDAEAQEFLLFVLRHMFALRNPEARAKSLIAFDEGPWYASHAVRSGAARSAQQGVFI